VSRVPGDVMCFYCLCAALVLGFLAACWDYHSGRGTNEAENDDNVFVSFITTSLLSMFLLVMIYGIALNGGIPK
jgi:hypothetical protein